MYHIDNKTQEEIELQASRAFVKEQLKTEVEEFYNATQDEAEELVHKLLPELNDDDIEDILLALLYIIGRCDSDTEFFSDNSRLLVVSDIIVSLSGTKAMMRLYGIDISELMDKSALVVLALEGIFYDFEQKSKHIGYDELGEKQYVTDTFARIYLLFMENDDLVPEWQHYMLPLIERPQEWDTNISGGYHTLEQSPILNMGEPKQPSNVLAVLNILQSNIYTLHPDTSYEDYYEIKVKKMRMNERVAEDTNDYMDMDINEILLDEDEQNKVKYTLTSFAQTIETMKDREFYFEWKFDFRGRLYETGYNIKNQGDKYQKGMVLPSPKNFKRN